MDNKTNLIKSGYLMMMKILKIKNLEYMLKIFIRNKVYWKYNNKINKNNKVVWEE